MKAKYLAALDLELYLVLSANTLINVYNDKGTRFDINSIQFRLKVTSKIMIMTDISSRGLFGFARYS